MAPPAASRHDVVSFRGGYVHRDVRRGSWPLASLTFDDECLHLQAPFAPEVALLRDEVAAVEVRRHAPLGFRIVVRDASGQALVPSFVPRDPGAIVAALEERGWDVERDLPALRIPPRVLLVVGIALLVVGCGEALVQSQRSTALDGRAGTVTARVVGHEVSAGKHLRVLEYEVAGEVHRLRSPGLRKPDGSTMTLRYDPDRPSRAWTPGDDPPGADTWTFGPLGVVPGILLVAFFMRDRGLRRRSPR